MCRWPRTARSTTVATTSRGCTVSSTRAPASPGLTPAGGSYSALTDCSRSGSRPKRRQATIHAARTRSGSANQRWSRRNQATRWAVEGNATGPFGHPPTTVPPSPIPPAALRVLDRRRPLGPDDVPVELVVVVEGEETPTHAVEDRHGPGGILGPRHPGFDLEVPPRVRDLRLERPAAVVEDLGAVDAEVEVKALALVADRDRAVDPLMPPPEREGDGLLDQEARVPVHLERDLERLDRIGAGLGSRGSDEGVQEENDGGEWAHEGPATCRTKRAEPGAPPAGRARRTRAS